MVVLAVASAVDLLPRGILLFRLLLRLASLLFFSVLRPDFAAPGFFLPLAVPVLKYGGNWHADALVVNKGILDGFCLFRVLVCPLTPAFEPLFSF